MPRQRPRSRERILHFIPVLGSKNRSEAIAAREQLVREYGSEALPLLREAARDPDPLLRCTAAMTLGDIPDPRSFDILAPMLQDEHDDVRYDVGVALGNLGDARAARLLEDVILSEDTQSDAVSGALQGIGGLGELAVDSLERLAFSGDTQIATCVPSMLARIGTSRSLAILESLRSHSSPEVRDAVEEELAELGGTGLR